VWVDRFGNCITNIGPKDLETLAVAGGGSIHVRVGGRALGTLVGRFESVMPGETGALIGSAGYVELFCNQGDLARQWNLGRGDEIFLQAASGR
jgi:S-adenosylmethionine hydrolase